MTKHNTGKVGYKRPGGVAHPAADGDRPGVYELDRVIKNTRDKITRLKFRMRLLRAKMACEDPIDPKMIKEYLNLNEQLRDYKIYESEFTFTRNKL